MMPLLTTQHYRQLSVIVAFAAFATLTMAAAQNAAVSSTTPKLVNGASAAAAAATNPLSNCSVVRSLFESQGINGADIPQQPITGKFFPFNYRRFDLGFTFSKLRVHSHTIHKLNIFIYLFRRTVRRSVFFFFRFITVDFRISCSYF